MKYDSILETVGRTPIVKLARLGPKHVSLYAKIESFNPMGSVKDRLALAVIERAEREGALKPGQTVIEATSGNTGIGLAMVCARKGYPLVIVMAENFSVERRRLMRFLGAKVVLTPASQKGSGMLAKAEELAAKHGWFLTRQFENEANADVHTATTGPEILSDFEGERLDYWVTTAGTGGTMKGTARALKAARQDIRVIVAEPDNSQVLGSGIPQPAPDGTLMVSHPYFRPHPVQGTSPDFIPKLASDAMAMGLVDRVVPVNGGEALRLSRELARKEGIFVGISAGATLAAALDVARSAPTGATIVCMFPDTGERYLSTPLFEDVPVDMTADELAISESTPMCRFGVSAPPAPAPAMEQAPSAAPRDKGVEDFVAEAISQDQVVLFALEWCEFCWSVRKLFAALSIPYRAVDLDSVAYQKGDMGGRIRAALKLKTGSPTIPQIFVGGEFVGGSTDIIGMATSGALQKRLAGLQVPFNPSTDVEYARLLPQWLSKSPKPQPVTAKG